MSYPWRYALILPLIWGSTCAVAECPTYAGHEWEFTGHLVNQVFPGPPDYESVASGDKPITRWYVQLRWPVCIEEFRHLTLTLFQLSLEPEEMESYRHLLGKEITVKGTLEEAVPGRHTTPLVVNVSSLVRFAVRPLHDNRMR
jgi:hypothetical protein